MDVQSRDPKFYVVGGPVQSGRRCYRSRVADAEFYERLADNEYCHVLAQRQSGKTSLIAATASKLRADGIGVAIVDLTAASAEDPSENAGRWYYSIVYRIVRDLRIKADIQSWWAERGGLTNLQRLREFFQEFVLQETEHDVVVFFDKLEATIGEPLAQDLFSCIRACYDARASNPEFRRLTFALVGSSSPGELVRSVQGSPFEVSRSVALPDFSPQELSGFIAGLGEPLTDAEAVTRRVWSWTRGHPYLSQKIFRGLARRRDEEISADSVDELVRTQFMSPNALREEPHLSAIADRILRPGPGRVARLNLYGRLRKGVEVQSDPTSVAQHQLETAGIVSVGPKGELRVRNEIYAMAFSTRWVNQNLPYGGRGLAVAVAVLALLIAVPVWYTEWLPRPYVRTLSAVNQDYEVARDAYESLARLPGHGSRAERLFETYLVRAAGRTSSLAEANRIYADLEELPGGAVRVPELEAAFWEREAVRLMHSGDRDAALVALLEAMRVPTDYRRRLAAELVGDDYDHLAGTARSGSRFREVVADERVGQVTLLDAQNNVQVWRVGGGQPRMTRVVQLIAEEQLALQQTREFDRLPRRPRLLLGIDHARPDQVEVRLRAPSGQTAIARLDQSVRVGSNLYAFDFNRDERFRALYTSDRRGNWALALTDTERGISGMSLGWDLVERSETELLPDAQSEQPVPEPRSTESAVAHLGPAGRFAASWATDSEMPGPILVWDLGAGNVVSRVPRSARLTTVRFVTGGERLLTLDGQRAELRDVTTGRLVGTIGTDGDWLSLAGLSSNGRFAAFRRTRADSQLEVVVWDLWRMERVGSPVNVSDVGPATVDSAARFLAIGGKDNWVRLWTLADGALRSELTHSAPVRLLRFSADGEWLASDDLGGTFRLWKLDEATAPVIEREGTGNWYVGFANDSSSLLYGSMDRPYEILWLPSVRNAGLRLRHSVVDRLNAAAGTAPAPLMLPSAKLAVTTDVANDVKFWTVEEPVSVAGDEAMSGEDPARGFAGGLRAALSRDGQLIAVGSRVSDLRVLAAGAPGELRLGTTVAAGGQAELHSLEFDPDRNRLAAGLGDGGLRLWDLPTATPVDVRTVHPDGPAVDLAFSADGRQLVSASSREVQVTNLDTGQTDARLRIQANHPQLVVARSADVLFIADDQDGVTAWNWQTGAVDRVVPREYRVRKLAVSDDGRHLVTAGADRTLIYWDVFRRDNRARQLQLAGRVDALFLNEDASRLTVQAGPWLHAIDLSAAGLTSVYTRLLDAVPVAVAPSADDALFVLSASRVNPVFRRVPLAVPPDRELAGSAAELRAAWYPRVAMQPGPEGRVLPVLAAEPAVTTVIEQPALEPPASGE